MPSKASIAKILSKISIFENPKPELEQYPTDSETAAILLHHAYMLEDIENKHIVDLGCGTGMLGIAALLLDAKHVDFLDIDKQAVELLKQNLETHHLPNATIHRKALQTMPADVVVMNPPFGIQVPHADKPFLEAAMRSAPIIYSIHLAGSEQFIDQLAKDHNYRRTHLWTDNMLLKNTMAHHKKKHKRIRVILVRLESDAKQ